MSLQLLYSSTSWEYAKLDKYLNITTQGRVQPTPEYVYSVY